MFGDKLLIDDVFLNSDQTYAIPINALSMSGTPTLATS